MWQSAKYCGNRCLTACQQQDIPLFVHLKNILYHNVHYYRQQELPSAYLANIGRMMTQTLQMYLSTTLHTRPREQYVQFFHFVSSHFSIVITREFYAATQSTVIETRPLQAQNVSNENNWTALEKMASVLIDISTVVENSWGLFFQRPLS